MGLSEYFNSYVGLRLSDASAFCDQQAFVTRRYMIFPPHQHFGHAIFLFPSVQHCRTSPQTISSNSSALFSLYWSQIACLIGMKTHPQARYDINKRLTYPYTAYRLLYRKERREMGPFGL